MENKDFTSMSEVDIAYEILTNTHEAKNYKQLIMEVIDKKRKTVQSMAVAIAEIYTMINMDSRFQHKGEGLWGLTEWNPPESKRNVSRGSSKIPTKTSTRRKEKLFESIQE